MDPLPELNSRVDADSRRARRRPGGGDTAELWPVHPPTSATTDKTPAAACRRWSRRTRPHQLDAGHPGVARLHSGHLLVVITADSSHSPANGDQLATVLVDPDAIAGTQAADRFDHYSLLRPNEELLGLPALANAATAADMAPAFNLRAPTPPTS